MPTDTPSETPENQTPPMPEVSSTLKKEQLSTQHIKPLYRGTQIIWYIVGVIEVLLAFRFILKLFAANPQAGFTKFIDGATWVFAGPFMILFRVTPVVAGSVFEWSTLFAMIVYLVGGWLIVKALVMMKPVSTEEADTKLPGQEKL
ncbi:MAG: YggT family protein [Patescibacteria group bacterium]